MGTYSTNGASRNINVRVIIHIDYSKENGIKSIKKYFLEIFYVKLTFYVIIYYHKMLFWSQIPKCWIFSKCQTGSK